MLGRLGTGLGLAGLAIDGVSVGIEIFEESNVDLDDIITVGIGAAAILAGGPLAAALGVGAVAISVAKGAGLMSWADDIIIFDWGGDQNGFTGNIYDLYHYGMPVY